MGVQVGLTAVDLLSVKQAKACLHTLDAEFNSIIRMSLTRWMTTLK